MRQVQLKQEDASLASYVAAAEAGETLTILRDGKPVAQIIPFPVPEPRVTEPARLAAIERIKAIMDHGYDLGIVWKGRDELYDRLLS